MKTLWRMSVLSAVCVVGCRAGGTAYGSLIATRDTLGDMVVVTTSSGSVWERPISLSPDLRIGSAEGNGRDAFGDIAKVAVEPDGTILVFDTQVPTLRRFSKSGRYLGTIGHKGQGPGEYVGPPNGLIVDRSGRIVLSDPSNARITIYSPDGRLLKSFGPVSGVISSLWGDRVIEDDAGRLYVPVLMVPPGPSMPTPWPIGAEVRAADGTVVDTIPPPLVAGDSTSFFSVLPDGTVVAAMTKKARLEIRHADGRVVRVDMPFQRVQYTEAERVGLQVHIHPLAGTAGDSNASEPEAKPAYIDVLCDPEDRIWLRRPVAPRSRQEADTNGSFQASVLDVFEEDGTYLGTVELPLRAMPMLVTATDLYAIELGEYDVQYVLRFKLPPSQVGSR